MSINLSKFIIPELNIWINKVLENKDHITIKYLEKANIDINIYNILNIQSFTVLSNIFNFSINTDDLCFNIFYYVNNDIINDPRLSKLKSKIKLYPLTDIYLSDNDTRNKYLDSTSYDINSNEIIPNNLFVSTHNSINIFQITYEEYYYLNLIFRLKQNKKVYSFEYETINQSSDLSKLCYLYLKLENENIFPENEIILSHNDNRILTQLFYQWLTDHIYRRLKLCKCIQSDNEKFVYIPTPKSKFVTISNIPEIIPLDGYIENLDMIQIFKDDYEIDKSKYSLSDNFHIILNDNTGNYYLCYAILDRT